MQRRVFAGVGGAILVAALLAPALPATAAIEPPSIPIIRPTAPGTILPSSYPTQEDLPVWPDNPNDASINRGVIPYDEIAPKLNALMDTSSRVSAQIVSKTNTGKDIYLVTLTSRETPAKTAQQAVWRDMIKQDPEAAAEDAALQAGYKVPIWFNGNIHGNEWEGTDATLNYISQLATSTDPAVKTLLDSTRLYFTVTINPEGRINGTRPPEAGYDINRDAVTGATPEGTILRDLASAIQPTYFVDLHGYTGVLQVEPCGPPHGENYEYDLFVPHAYAAALAVEEAVTSANIPGNTYMTPSGGVTTTNTGKINIPYRDQREGWDDWPPIFAPQYLAYQGAITNTVELPLARVNPATSNQNKINSAINIQVAGVVINTIVDYVTEHRGALLDNQMEIFRRGDAGEPSVEIPADIAPEDLGAGVPTEWTTIWDATDIYVADYPRAYVLPIGAGQRSNTDAETLVEQLIYHDIEVQKATAPFEAGGKSYPAGSYVVDMHQPLRGLANVLLDEGTDISARIGAMYDISAWSLALTWGADVDSVGETTDAALTFTGEQVTEVTSAGTVPAAGTYLAFEPRGVAEWQAVNELLDEGIALSQLPDKTIILGPDEASYAAATAVSAMFGVNFVASDGKALRDGESKALQKVTVGYTGSNEDRDMLAKLGFRDATPVSAATITSGAVNLANIDALWIGSSLSFSGSQTAGTAAVQAYLAAGKPVAGRGTAISSFVNAFGITTVTGSSASSSSNGIVQLVGSGVNTINPWPQDTAFIYPATRYSNLGTNAVVESRYATNPLISGHWLEANRLPFGDQPATVSAVGPTGSKAYLFGYSPVFRNHPIGAFGDIASALFWGSLAGDTAVTPPAPDPITEADLVEDSRGAVTVPESADQGETIAVSVGAGHAEEVVSTILFPGDVALGTATVVGEGYETTIPGTTVPGNYKVAVVGADGLLIGWDDVRVIASEISVERIFGNSRYTTAVELSKDSFPSTAPVVYIATGAGYPDALSAGPAAAHEGGPLLLVKPTEVPAEVVAEIERLDPSKIVVIGGLPSVSAAAYTELTALTDEIERIAGANRYETSRLIAESAFESAEVAYVATGANFPDALAAGAAAAKSDAPVVLVNGASREIDAATSALLTGLEVTSIKVLGGPGSVSADVEAGLAAVAPVTRFAGANRYDTSLLVNADAFTTADSVYLATGANFPDALAGSTAAAAADAPLFVVQGTCVPQAVLDEIDALGASTITLIGGLPSLSLNVENLVSCTPVS